MSLAEAMAPSKGERRFKRTRRGHKPANVLKRKLRALDTVRLFRVLREREWKFKFKVEALSPRGFKYEAFGETPEEAFLRAFGQWRNDFSALIPKIPSLLKSIPKAPAAEPAPTPSAYRKNLESVQPDKAGILRASWEKVAA